ncbi:MAG: hypothetical protein KKI09_04285 [Spirochaetes bacterium]|nr:hypothetical protein [Spirochaetota bacterium]MBU0954628.1 hypothetical protein [Spirochaetota bacterium]
MTVGLLLVLAAGALPLFCAWLSVPYVFSFPAYGLTAAAALLAFGFLCLSPLLSGRYRLMERLGGIGRWYRIHMIIPLVLLLIATTHYIHRLSLYPRSLQTTGGELAFWLLFAGISSALLFLASPIRGGPIARLREQVRRKIPMKYSIARLMHNLLLVCIVLLTLHILQSNLAMPQGDQFPLMRVCILAYGCLGLGLGLWPKLRRRLSGRLRWSTRQNSGEAVACFSLEADRPFSFRPGQYGFFRLRGKTADGRRLNGEPHPFSFTTLPGQKTAGICVKALGDYTRELHQQQLPAEGSWEGPFGSFTLPPAGDILMLAGGIGITPFLSWLQQLRTEGYPGGRAIKLLWALRHEGENFCTEALDTAASLNGFSLQLHYSGKDDSKRVGVTEIKTALAGLIHPGVYLCGPPGFVAVADSYCRQAGVPVRQIHREQFSL